jgi:hypothetical protein
MRIFASDGDHRAFMKAMADALDEVPMRILGLCLVGTAGDWNKRHWRTSEHALRVAGHMVRRLGSSAPSRCWA